MGSLRWSQEQLASALKTGGVKISGREPGKKHSKYGNEKTEVDGIKLDSRKEAKRWKELRLLLKTGHITWLARQVEFILPGGIIYRADFYYGAKPEDGQPPWVQQIVVEDCKGYLTPEYKLKRKLMLERGISILET